MIKIDELYLKPSTKIFFLVDSCFLANRYLPHNHRQYDDKENVMICKNHWNVIEKYLKKQIGSVYIPDIIISETFKVFAKKYYRTNQNVFKSSYEYQRIKKRLENDLRLNIQELKAANRKILYHDVHVDRDILIGASRFFEIFYKHFNRTSKKYRKDVSIPDLILLSTAKYFIDFYGIPKENIIIVSSDKAIIEIAKYCPDIPNVFNPYFKKNDISKLMERKIIEKRINAKLVDD